MALVFIVYRECSKLRPEERVCSRCRDSKLLSEFHKCKTDKKYGVQSTCKGCKSKYQEENRERGNEVSNNWYHNNKEKVIDYRKKFESENPDIVKQWKKNYILANPEKRKETCRAYRENNKEKERVYRTRYRAENKEAINERSRKWRSENPAPPPSPEQLERKRQHNKNYVLNNLDKVREAKRRYRKNNKGKERSACRNRRRRVRRATTWEKVDFEKVLKTYGKICYLCGENIEANLHFDHVVPLSRGGSHTEANIRPTHGICNMRKSNKLLEELEWHREKRALRVRR